MKKCNKCGKKKSDFGINRHNVDGLSDTCKTCVRDHTKERRRKLDVMLRNVDPVHHEQFEKLWKEWSKNGFPPHSKPIIVDDQCVTFMEGKGQRKRKGLKVILKGEKDVEFKSISDASRSTGDSRLYIRWSSLNGIASENRNKWEIRG